jgi:hypothetical protein
LRALALLALAAATLGAAALPPAAESLRPAIQLAERRLQDASLQMEAARHAAQPAQEELNEARQGASSWWGSWVYERRLGQLKTRLDAVEAARAAQAEARQELSLLLTGADEELSTALEASLGAAGASQAAADVEKWRSWWAQKRAWQQRLGSLGPAPGGADAEAASSDKGSLRIQAELKQAQFEREKALVDLLHRHQALSQAQWGAERARLDATMGAPARKK